MNALLHYCSVIKFDKRKCFAWLRYILIIFEQDYIVKKSIMAQILILCPNFASFI